MLSSQDKNTKDANKQKKTSMDSHNTKSQAPVLAACALLSIVSTWSPPLWIVSLGRSTLLTPFCSLQVLLLCFMQSEPSPTSSSTPFPFSYLFISPISILFLPSRFSVVCVFTWILLVYKCLHYVFGVFDSPLSVGHLCDHNVGRLLWIHVPSQFVFLSKTHPWIHFRDPGSVQNIHSFAKKILKWQISCLKVKVGIILYF